MKKLIIVYVVLIVAVILLFVVKTGGNPLSFIHLGSSATAEIGNNKINLIIAKSADEKMKGLSGRNSLPQNQGMLFLFDTKDKYGFWMKDMKFSIDIIYLDDNTVVYIVKNAPSSVQAPALTVYKPSKPANRVLELNAGQADKFGIKEGTTIKFNGVK